MKCEQNTVTIELSEYLRLHENNKTHEALIADKDAVVIYEWRPGRGHETRFSSNNAEMVNLIKLQNERVEDYLQYKADLKTEYDNKMVEKEVEIKALNTKITELRKMLDAKPKTWKEILFG